MWRGSGPPAIPTPLDPRMVTVLMVYFTFYLSMVLKGNPFSIFTIFVVKPVALTARSPSFLPFTYISHVILPTVPSATPCKRYLFTLFNHCFNFLHHYCSFRFHVVIMDDSEEAKYYNSIQRSCHAGKLKKIMSTQKLPCFVTFQLRALSKL